MVSQFLETNRSVLRFTAKLFDLIWVLMPFTVVMFRQLCLINTAGTVCSKKYMLFTG